MQEALKNRRIRMTLYTVVNKTYKERLEYLKEAYSGEYDSEKRIHFLKKFNDAVGFKKAEEMENPDEYLTPYSLFLQNIYFLDQSNEIASFIIEDKYFEHPIKSYAYDSMDMLLKFQKFLYKIFPNDIRIEIAVEAQEVPLKKRVLSYFLNCIAESECVDAELSIPRKLSEKEEKYILNIVNQCIGYTAKIRCGLCETCFEYHPDAPYHIELVDVEYEKKEEQLSIKYGYYKTEYLEAAKKRSKELERKVKEYRNSKKMD